MSWDSYRDSLTGSGLVQKAAICGVTDGSVWSQSPDFNVSWCNSFGVQFCSFLYLSAHSHLSISVRSVFIWIHFRIGLTLFGFIYTYIYFFI